MNDQVHLGAEDGVLLITLDRPPANAIDVPTSNALYTAFERLNSDPDLCVAIVTGAGERFFSAGWDLKAASAGEAPNADHGPGGFAGLTELFDLDKPVIAAVNGLAVGGGFELALAADLIVAAEHAEFSLPEVTVGLVPDSGGLLRLPRQIPHAIANEMLMTGRRMRATEAEHWGLVNRVEPDVDVLDSAMDMARQVCAAAPLAVAAVKEVTRTTESTSVEDGFTAMRGEGMSAYRAVLDSEDAVEGARAFAQKREPRWAGR